VGVTDGAPTPGRRQALRDGVFVALGLPLALTGIALHGLGYRATSASVTALRPEPDTSATYQLAAGLLLFPLSWLLEGIVVAWARYDFANSAFAAVVMSTIYAAYFAGFVVGNTRGEGDLWWGRVVSVSMAIVAVTSPILGAVADLAGVRKPLFIGFTLLSIA